MRRRLKLTPFAKIFILALVITGARYLYINKEELSDKKNLFFRDTVATERNNANNKVTDTVIKKNIIPDTIIFYVSKNNDILTLRANGKSVNINFKDTITGTLVFEISEKENLKGKIIITE